MVNTQRGNRDMASSNYDDEKRFSKDNISLSRDFPIKYATFNAY